MWTTGIAFKSRPGGWPPSTAGNCCGNSMATVTTLLRCGIAVVYSMLSDPAGHSSGKKTTTSLSTAAVPTNFDRYLSIWRCFNICMTDMVCLRVSVCVSFRLSVCISSSVQHSLFQKRHRCICRLVDWHPTILLATGAYQKRMRSVPAEFRQDPAIPPADASALSTRRMPNSRNAKFNRLAADNPCNQTGRPWTRQPQAYHDKVPTTSSPHSSLLSTLFSIYCECSFFRLWP